MVKKLVINVTIIVLVITLAIYIINQRNNLPETTEEITKCIANHSILYIQNGCIHCIKQEKLFGENFKFVNYINCSEDFSKCANIEATPTWVINNEKLTGVKEISNLQELTGC